MSDFGQTLFGGSRFIRWTLTPFVVLFAVAVLVIPDDWSLKAGAISIALAMMCILLLAGFWLPKRIGHLAFRGLAGLVFLLYLVYLIDGIISWHRAGEAPINPFLGFLVIGLPSLMFSALGRFSLRAEPSPEMLASERQSYEDTILRPDWKFYEHHLQRPIPAARRELYADRNLVTDGGFSYNKNIGIGSFAPLNEQCLLDTRDQVGTAVVAIATSDCGDPIYLRPGCGEPDKVYVTYHDEDKTEELAESVAEFLTKVRNANRAK